MIDVASWGRLSRTPHQPLRLHDRDNVASLMAENASPGIPFGMGRSYGDVALNPEGRLWLTRGLNHFIRFDEESGLLECEAGVTLQEIQQLLVPRGWMLPVTPGSWFVTVGGAIANDVHGKNHHSKGTFGEHVVELTLARSDGRYYVCSPEQEPGLFAATVGGLGLTGIITSVVMQLRRVPGPWLEVETAAYESLGEFFQLADASERDWEYTISWVDCLSGEATRGIFMRANHADFTGGVERVGAGPRVPFDPPVSLANRLTLKPLNSLYYHLHRRRAGVARQHYVPFFYPLDAIRDWNRVYGPRGFYQYQCVVPEAHREEGVLSLLREIHGSGEGSILSTLKTLGERKSPGLLSFPQPGVTLALDFPNRGQSTLRLMERLDALLGEMGGRLYPAKDARMSKESFRAGFPQLNAFLSFRDPGLSSAMSRRLMGS